jgi:hypothetical protein
MHTSAWEKEGTRSVQRNVQAYSVLWNSKQTLDNAVV